jgi:hypothetical protein
MEGQEVLPRLQCAAVQPERLLVVFENFHIKPEHMAGL